jgi:hypothetical protein
MVDDHRLDQRPASLDFSLHSRTPPESLREPPFHAEAGERAGPRGSSLISNWPCRAGPGRYRRRRRLTRGRRPAAGSRGALRRLMSRLAEPSLGPRCPCVPRGRRRSAPTRPPHRLRDEVVDVLLGQIRRVPRNRAVVGVVMQNGQAVMSSGGGDNKVYRGRSAMLARAGHLVLDARNPPPGGLRHGHVRVKVPAQDLEPLGLVAGALHHQLRVAADFGERHSRRRCAFHWGPTPTTTSGPRSSPGSPNSRRTARSRSQSCETSPGSRSRQLWAWVQLPGKVTFIPGCDLVTIPGGSNGVAMQAPLGPGTQATEGLLPRRLGSPRSLKERLPEAKPRVRSG